MYLTLDLRMDETRMRLGGCSPSQLLVLRFLGPSYELVCWMDPRSDIVLIHRTIRGRWHAELPLGSSIG